MPSPNLHDLIDPASLTFHLENTSFGVMLWDVDAKLIYCSQKATAILGYSPDDLLQTPVDLLELVYAEDIPAVSDLIDEITSGRTAHNENLNRNSWRVETRTKAEGIE